MFDFASDGRNEGGQPGSNDKGLVTHDRATRKDAFYFYKANWAATPIAVHHQPALDAAHDGRHEREGLLQRRRRHRHPQRRLPGRPHLLRPHLQVDRRDLRSGANTVQVTATINGTPVTDTVTWTLG